MTELKCSEYIIDKIDMSDIKIDKNKSKDLKIHLELRRLNNKLPEEKYNKTKFLKYLQKNESKLKENNIEELIKIWNSDIFTKNQFFYKINIKKNKKPTPYQLIEYLNEKNKQLIQKKLKKNSIRNNLDLRLTNINFLTRNFNRNYIETDLTLPHIKNNKYCHNNLLNYYKNVSINNSTRRNNHQFSYSDSLNKNTISIENSLRTIRNNYPKNKKILFNTILH